MNMESSGNNEYIIQEIANNTTMTEDQAFKLYEITNDVEQVRRFARLKDYGLPLRSIYITAELGADAHILREAWQDMMGENIITECHLAAQKMKSFLNPN
ncbi:MAG: hypothetical protein WD037_13490 [Balneolales bacterium]